MFVINTDFVPGMEVTKICGLVQGSTVRAKHIGRDIMASLKSVVGGELKGYTELLNEARDEAMRRMVERAKQIGANAILNLRFETNSIAQNASELFCYGTAVVLTPVRQG
ncbi:MAG: YbjQ family protein [Thermoguttaceae bacterium]